VDNNDLDLGMTKSGFIHTLPSGRLTHNGLEHDGSIEVINFLKEQEQRSWFPWTLVLCSTSERTAKFTADPKRQL
jgi:hypothetical protein